VKVTGTLVFIMILRHIFLSSLIIASCHARLTNTFNSKKENAKKEDMRQLQTEIEDDGSDCGFGDPAKTTLFSNNYDDTNCPSTYDNCLPSVCLGIDLVFSGIDAPQVSEDFPGNYNGNSTDNSQNTNTVGPGSSFVFWDTSNKVDTLQCYKSKGRFSSPFVPTEDGDIRYTVHGHAFFFYFETDKVTVDGSNAKVQIKTPGFYLSQGGTATTISDPGFTDVLYTKLEGRWLDICAEVSSGSGESSTSCEEKEEEDCITDDNCMWKKKKGCISMSWGNKN